MTDLKEARKQAVTLQKQLQGMLTGTPELKLLIEAATSFTESPNWHGDTQKLYGEAIGLSQELQVHLDACPRLVQSVELAEKLVNEIGWQWVRN